MDWIEAYDMSPQEIADKISNLERQLAEARTSAEEAWSECRECRELSVRDGKIVAALEQQLAEARRKAFEEAERIAEKMTPLSGMGVQTGRHIAKALREEGERGLEG